jgi:hypothetical protein
MEIDTYSAGPEMIRPQPINPTVATALIRQAWIWPAAMAATTIRTMDRFVDLFDRLTVANNAFVTSSFHLAAPGTAPPPAARRADPLGDPAGSGGPPPAGSDPATGDKPEQATDEEPVAVTVDSIRARAYELYERRGHQPGEAVDDWRRAEADLRAAGAVAHAAR